MGWSIGTGTILWSDHNSNNLLLTQSNIYSDCLAADTELLQEGAGYPAWGYKIGWRVGRCLLLPHQLSPSISNCVSDRQHQHDGQH